MRATSRLLADATARRNLRGRVLVQRLRALGVRSATMPKAAAAAALRARAAGRGVDRATVARLLRKHLIARASDVRTTLRADTPRKAQEGVDLLRALERPVATARMRAAGRALTLGDVAPAAAGGPARHARAVAHHRPDLEELAGPCSATPGRARRCRCSPTWRRPDRGCPARPGCSCGPRRSRSRRTTCAATRRAGPDARPRSAPSAAATSAAPPAGETRAGLVPVSATTTAWRSDCEAPERDLDGLAGRPSGPVEQPALDCDVERARRRLEGLELDRREAAATEHRVLAGIEVARHQPPGAGLQPSAPRGPRRAVDRPRRAAARAPCPQRRRSGWCRHVRVGEAPEPDQRDLAERVAGPGQRAEHQGAVAAEHHQRRDVLDEAGPHRVPHPHGLIEHRSSVPVPPGAGGTRSAAGRPGTSPRSRAPTPRRASSASSPPARSRAGSACSSESASRAGRAPSRTVTTVGLAPDRRERRSRCGRAARAPPGRRRRRPPRRRACPSSRRR